MLRVSGVAWEIHLLILFFPSCRRLRGWVRCRRRLAMFVVLGASGNTGKVVAETLLRQKKNVRVVLHDAAKGKAWSEAGADVAIADVDEGAALERAFSGAEGVYVLLPPNFSSSHVRVDNNRRRRPFLLLTPCACPAS